VSDSDFDEIGLDYCPTYYPNSGTLHYDGHLDATATMEWGNPQWEHPECIFFTIRCATYEHDLKVSRGFLAPFIDISTGFPTWCVTTTDLPNPYDDCPTAGIDDPAGYLVLSFGSWNAHRIERDHSYTGTWHFLGLGDVSNTTAGLYGQEGYNTVLPPFTVNPEHTHHLISTEWSHGTESEVAY